MTSSLELNQRPIPSAALNDPESVEMLRIWIARSGLHCSMKIGMFASTSGVPEEKAWGVVLADAARHIANALEATSGRRSRDTLSQIREAFDRELAQPTSIARGAFADRN